jgi:hypothetical protein
MKLHTPDSAADVPIAKWRQMSEANENPSLSGFKLSWTPRADRPPILLSIAIGNNGTVGFEDKSQVNQARVRIAFFWPLEAD